MKSTYFSLSNLNNLQIKLSTYQVEKSKLEKLIEEESTKCIAVENQLISLDNKLEKIIQKLKKNPKTTYQKCWNIFNFDQKPFHDLINQFGKLYTNVYYQYPYDINKINQNIDETNHIIEDVKIGLTNHFHLYDNLPEQFNQALNHLNTKIKTWYKNDQAQQLKTLSNKLNKPLFNAIIEDSQLYKSIQKHNIELNEQMTNEQIIELLKNVDIYLWRNNTNSLINLTNNYIYKINKLINRQNNRDVIKEAETYFQEIKYNFVDQIACYCWDIKSVSNIILGDDGSINGTIHASNGNYYIKTISAGGYNIQVFHYRIIMKKIKG